VARHRLAGQRRRRIEIYVGGWQATPRWLFWKPKWRRRVLEYRRRARSDADYVWQFATRITMVNFAHEPEAPHRPPETAAAQGQTEAQALLETPAALPATAPHRLLKAPAAQSPTETQPLLQTTAAELGIEAQPLFQTAPAESGIEAELLPETRAAGSPTEAHSPPEPASAESVIETQPPLETLATESPTATQPLQETQAAQSPTATRLPPQAQAAQSPTTTQPPLETQAAQSPTATQLPPETPAARSPTEAHSSPKTAADDKPVGPSLDPLAHTPPPRRASILGILITCAVVALATALGWVMWDSYMGAPWTRDGTVRAYVVTMAPEVAGRIVELPVADNQFVHKGDLLLRIDPTDYKIAGALAETAAEQAQANAENTMIQAERRRRVTTLAATVEEKQNFATNAEVAQAQHQQAVANLDQARVNLQRTEIRSPVNGWVTNLLARKGNYATVGVNQISVVDADSFWVDAYFEETSLGSIRESDPASVMLMGYNQIIRGHVGGIARGINVANAQPNTQGVATVNPIFTWVRLAQRIPVRIHIDNAPDGVRLAAGLTATVQIDSPRRSGKFREWLQMLLIVANRVRFR
jgi:RND family efflux transporter MFP subunit